MGINPSRRFTRPAAGAKIDNLDVLLTALESGDDHQAERAMHALIAEGERIIPLMRTWLDSPNAERRWWAVGIFAQIDVADVDLILPALRDESVEVRQAAALGISHHPSPKALPALLDTLRDTDRMLASLSANALAEIGEAAVPPLLALLEQDDVRQSARVEAMRALAKIGDTRAIPAMMAALEEDSALMQHWAEAGLEKLGLDMVYMKLV